MQLQLKLFEEPMQEYGAIVIHGAKRYRKFSYLKPGVPRLVIEGKWLNKFGKRVGDCVELEYHRDRIVIKFME